MEKTQRGAEKEAQKEATEQRMKVAVASIMHPACRTTGMLRRMLASNQQQNADLLARLKVSVAVASSAVLVEPRRTRGLPPPPVQGI